MLSPNVFKQIEEVKYLTVENTWRYRPIIRILYKHHECYKYWVYKEEIYEELKKYKEFKDYTLENLRYDLDYLVENKNLITLQDTKNIKTIEEFKNRQFQYQLSQYTIEIERMIMHLENISLQNQASLEASLVESFEEKLEKFFDIKDKDAKTVYNWWISISDDFKKLNENYQDYIKSFYSPKAEELMQTTEFLIYKENLIKYLREFIKGIQSNSSKIEKRLKSINEDEVKYVIQKVFEYEKTIPRMDFDIKEDEYLETNIERWKSVFDWFISNSNRISDCEKILDITNEIIMKTTRYASQISERRNSSANRKMEYRKLLELFYCSKDLDEANILSAVTIGIFNMRHIRGNTIRETESIYSSIYEESPHEYILKPKNRKYRERIIKTPMKDKSAIKEELKREIEERIKMEKEIMESLIHAGKIEFKSLPIITSFQRNTLLRWLSRANNNKSKKSKTEYGRDYEAILLDDENITLECEDGTLVMPNFILKFY
ncbi:TIGR02677 family protein [Caloramator quimbayensis]|uniref:TIGR02677 family protein n=1 Tax=Caloramator quimbayensis TaxID=1147123 RepID=A0A1T4YB34_9CLOT|nr:TIGR02677 family protein [Caloramator quimbayensis]SKA98883.1 TIGR02677 family protein [Caloramator quimbayensis]